MKTNAITLIDGYKTNHHRMFPKGTEMVYCNFTPRNVDRMPEMAKDIVVFGVQYTIKYIHEIFNDTLFNAEKECFLQQIKEYYSNYLAEEYNVDHFEKLYDLGYLPIEIKGLEEGTIIGEKIPILTIVNTLPDFFWLPNFLETLISSLLWKSMHSASLAYGFKKILLKHAKETDQHNLGFVNFQGHDFSFRGMQHPESAISSGMGWLTSFKGTDTVPAVHGVEYYYGMKNAGFSVSASEHSVMTAYGSENEFEAFETIIDEFPNGVLALVSDSYDLWNVITNFLPRLKDKIMARNGKIVCRPDSGDPVDIICGLKSKYKDLSEYIKQKGVIESLWDIFGGTINDQGYKVLDPHIGCIYGDSITLERADEICQRLKEKGFASTNIVLGVGSYSLSCVSRDQQGCAMKATACIVNGEFREIFKDPITGNKEKKSARGLLMAYEEDGIIKLKDQCTIEEEKAGLLKTIYKDGNFIKHISFEEIKEKIDLSILL